MADLSHCRRWYFLPARSQSKGEVKRSQRKSSTDERTKHEKKKKKKKKKKKWLTSNEKNKRTAAVFTLAHLCQKLSKRYKLSDKAQSGNPQARYNQLKIEAVNVKAANREKLWLPSWNADELGFTIWKVAEELEALFLHWLVKLPKSFNKLSHVTKQDFDKNLTALKHLLKLDIPKDDWLVQLITINLTWLNNDYVGN